MILSSLKKVSVATLGALALTVGMGSTALAGSVSVSATTAGMDSGFDSVIEEIRQDPQVIATLAALRAQYGDDVSLRDLLDDPIVQAVLQDPQTASQTINLAQIAPQWLPLVSALQNSTLLTALQIINVPGVLNSLDPATAALIDAPIMVVLDQEKPDDFFKIAFNAGPLDAYIESITFDLGADLDAAFDNRDFFLYDASPKVGTASGLTASDISFSPVTRNDFDNPNPTRLLTINFAQGSFGFGDFFTFGVDTNGIGTDVIAALAQFNSLTNDNLSTFNDTGADFGRAGVKFAVKLENGKSGEGTFGVVAPVASVARVNINWDDNPTSVPEPGTVAGLVLLGVMGAPRRRQRQG